MVIMKRFYYEIITVEDLDAGDVIHNLGEACLVVGIITEATGVRLIGLESMTGHDKERGTYRRIHRSPVSTLMRVCPPIFTRCDAHYFEALAES